jgi:predicted aconitase with swiveling domain
MIEINCKRIVGNKKIKGLALVSIDPLNMLSMVDPNSGMIKNRDHVLFNETVKDRILILPNCIGSTVGAYIFYSLKINNTGPKAIICTNRCDAILASGCAISDIPLVESEDPRFRSLNNNIVTVDTGKEIIIIHTV